MFNKKFLSVLFLIFFSLGLIVAKTSANTWKIETVDVSKYFLEFCSRAITLDIKGYPHIAYGGDHLYYAHFDGHQWNCEIVDSSADVGRYASIALDSSGKAYISYYDESNGDLKYATNASGSWENTIVDSDENVGAYTSIALDSASKAHISYHYYNFALGDKLKYATNASGSWITETVGSSRGFTSIALDVVSHAHISYYDEENLKYATNANGSWVTTAVDEAGKDSTGVYTSIALNGAGNAHISYYNYGWDGDGDRDLKYATNDSGSWVTETVDSGGDVGKYASIALVGAGRVYISYYDATNGDLKYATNDSGSWVTETVDSGGDTGLYTSIAIDGAGKAHISYYNEDVNYLLYNTNASGSWVKTMVDSRGDDVGMYTSLDLDSAGKAHISYEVGYPEDYLKYATNVSGSWVTTPVDSSGDVSGYNSLAVDATGKVHISYRYYNFTTGETSLKYTTNASGSWVTTIVDSSGDVGSYNSLALDATGKVHISYYDYYEDDWDVADGDLKYATNASGSWVITTVDNDGDTGRHTSIALDAAGKAHISYNGGGLKYAANASGSWVTTTVDSDSYGNVGENTSIALDSKRKVHISYFGRTNDSSSGLKYATNVSRSWVKETIDSSWSRYSSIALDVAGKAHISYKNNIDNGIKYATNGSGSWVTTTVDSDIYGDAGGHFTSIALDDAGNAHISYCIQTSVYDSELKYATKAIQSQPCEPEQMTTVPEKVEVTINSSAQETIAITCGDDTPVEGEQVTWKITKGKKKISISPGSAITDANGRTVFTITGAKKGNATVQFKSGGLKVKVKVKVTK